MKKIVECQHCGNNLDFEERDDPRRDDCGDPICDECWSEKYEFNCCWCGEYEHIDEQHKMLVVFESCGGLEPGVYSIDSGPYWTSDYFSMWFNLDCLTRLGNLPRSLAASHEGYPSGHLCRNCRDKLSFPKIWGVPEIANTTSKQEL